MFEFGDEFIEFDGELFPASADFCCEASEACSDLGDGVWVVDAGILQVVNVSFVAAPPLNPVSITG